MTTGLLRALNIVKVGLRSIARNKMRSALTILGIVIGVGCVIVTNGIGSGASSSIQANINSLGANFIMIFPGTSTQGGAHFHSEQSSLTEDDANAIKAECPSVAYVSPGLRSAVATRSLTELTCNDGPTLNTRKLSTILATNSSAVSVS